MADSVFHVGGIEGQIASNTQAIANISDQLVDKADIEVIKVNKTAPTSYNTESGIRFGILLWASTTEAGFGMWLIRVGAAVASVATIKSSNALTVTSSDGHLILTYGGSGTGTYDVNVCWLS